MQSKSKKLKDKILRTFLAEIKESNFYQIDFKSALDRCLKELGGRQIESLLCYGLGSFHDGVETASRYQLALLILMHGCLKDRGHSISTSIEVYDPSFDSIDKEVLTSFSEPSFRLIEENEYCARRIATTQCDTCVLVYMPHLDKYLYNNLLGANWTSANLQLLVILGNSFQEMIDTEIPSKRRSDLHYMNQLVADLSIPKQLTAEHRRKNKNQDSVKILNGPLVELPVDDTSFKHADIFNSLSFHVFRKTWLVKYPEKIRLTALPNWSCVTSELTEVWVE